MKILKKLFSIETKSDKAFFRPIDWTAFWSVTVIAFLVYLFTLGPSVGLEDSGELATAGDHLGVPHPPGYPFWTLCSWIFCRVFSWVKYMGQPTPAWAISCFSAVAGAFAAGCTAMLITRSASDMLDSASKDSAGYSPHRNALMSFAAAFGGSLAFAFSPVEWSQSTIVEIYSLNALFLMAVFLLSYRWMRKPSDKILWLTAFIFGLGLTNYQVLLLAIVPLGIIIFFKDIRLFRDTLALMIPVGLTAKLLQIGSMMRASNMMDGDVINKWKPVTATKMCPNSTVMIIACALLVLAPIVAVAVRHYSGKIKLGRNIGVGLAGLATILFFLGSSAFVQEAHWVKIFEIEVAPLVEPGKYALIAGLLAASFTAALVAALAPKEDKLLSPGVLYPLIASAAIALITLLVAANMPAAGSYGYRGTVFSWSMPTLMLVLGLAALFAITMFSPRGLAFFIPVAAVQTVAFMLLKSGYMNGLTHPMSWWFGWAVVWGLAVLSLGYVTLSRGKTIVPAAFFAVLGVSFYAYMPIVSDLRNPPMNWGYPRTWEGFKHAIMRGQYEAIVMPNLFSAEGFSLFMKQLGFYFQDLRMQFTLVAAALALLPFAAWRFVVRSAGKVVKVSGIWIASFVYILVAGLVVVFSELCENVTGGEVPLRLDKYLLVLLAAIGLIGIVAIVARQVWVLASQLMNYKADEKKVREVSFGFASDDVSQQWLVASGVCFVLMSLFLVSLANVKGDIQDGFIQKVKFISSHGMFALWIGYGLAYGLTVANAIAHKIRHGEKFLFAVFALLAMMVAAIPVYENYTNKDLVFAMGSAEQNGHTFGWQFGNYQLRGADAIREELRADEEPLPNPKYPKEMDFGAIFFGGTDPGRFVPTYMIYSADVRPDVYLITQNALADDTYMSVERDLYGDEIWIPSKEDSAQSFNIYVDEVKSGKRQANGDLNISNGRVQVTGALGVMEINGILTKMMFDHEKRRRSFYIEESYAIQWMYPYLSPHGLIMKINRDPVRLTQTDIANDMEFWDWYTRRLLRDKAYRRDFPGQKSFSKLRAAIAGLYVRQNWYTQAELAYREACLLYPASPEASFRYIQEILFPMRKYDQINDLLDWTDTVDPNNTRTGNFRAYLQKYNETQRRIGELAKLRSENKATVLELFELANIYIGMGAAQQSFAIAGEIAKRPEAKVDFNVGHALGVLYAGLGQRGEAAKIMNAAMALAASKNAIPALPAGVANEAFKILEAGGLYAEAKNYIGAYMTRNKTAEAYLALCVAQDALHETRNAQISFIEAYKINENRTMELLNADANLQRIAAPLFKQQ